VRNIEKSCAGFRIDTKKSFLVRVYVNPLSTVIEGNHGSVASARVDFAIFNTFIRRSPNGYGACFCAYANSFIGRFPNGSARHFIEGNDGGCWTADPEDHFVSINVGRFGKPPVRQLNVVFCSKVSLPNFVSGGSRDASNSSEGREGVDSVAINRWSSSLAGIPSAFLNPSPSISVTPEFFARRFVKGKDIHVGIPVGLAGSDVACGENPTIGNGNAGIAGIFGGADAGGFPEERRSSFGPRLQQTGVGRHAVPIETAKNRPRRTKGLFEVINVWCSSSPPRNRRRSGLWTANTHGKNQYGKG
jgi:hypothetical protein